MKVRIFTDGACSGNPGPGGWAAILLFQDGKQEISGFEEDTTNNRMELKATVQALSLAISMGHTKVELFSDSSYVVNAVRQHWIKKWAKNGWKTTKREDVKNKDLWIQLIRILKHNRDIKILKVAGHSGNKYNDLVDVLAKREIELKKAW